MENNTTTELKFTIKQIGKQGQSITALRISSDNKFAYSASKDGSIIKWDLEKNKKLFHRRNVRNRTMSEGHTNSILSLALSFDAKILASGGKDNLIIIWETQAMKVAHKLKGHRECISSLAFAADTYYLFSGSYDRTVKHWNASTLTYIESLFGHEDHVNCVDSIDADRVLACGSDRTIRLFKISSGTQLVFKALKIHSASIDCCCFVTRREFVAGSQDGVISLWEVGKKKPLCVAKSAHSNSWIVCISSIINSDTFFTGASDGSIKKWEIKRDSNDAEKGSAETVSFSCTSVAKVKGFVNSLSVVKGENRVFAAVGKDHRFGRWKVVKEATNAVVEIEFK